MGNRMRYPAGYGILLVLLVILLALNLGTGSVTVPPGEIVSVLLARGGESMAARVIWDLRLPRTLAACLLGGALSVSGFLLQTFFANPIAGPFVLGISSGAKLTVALAMIAALERGRALGSWAMVLAAFAGSLLCMGLILPLAGRGTASLVVCGVMIGYLCSAVTDFVVTFADDANIVNLHNWSRGSFAGIRNWDSIRAIALITLSGTGLSFLLSKPMGAYQLGEAYAQNMGVRLRRFRLELVTLSSILSACVTAFAGPVSFVGIAVPHLAKSLFGTARPLLMVPACFLGGGVFCLLCDLLARTLFAPAELAVSSVTAVLGAPVVLWILGRRRI